MTDGGFADRLNRLFTSVRADDGRTLSNAKVAKALGERGMCVSREYLRLLRRGERTNPRLELVEALADYFSVSTSYLLDGSQSMPSLPERGSSDWVDMNIVCSGTPGEGKTEVIAQVLRSLTDRQVVVICSPSNELIDRVVETTGWQSSSRAVPKEIMEWLESQFHDEDTDQEDDGSAIVPAGRR